MSFVSDLRARVSLWWGLACAAAATLASPKTDAAAFDASFEASFRDSAAARAADRLLAVLDRAWIHSRLGGALCGVAAASRALGSSAAIRVGGVVAAVAGSVASVLGLVQPTPVGLSSSLLPALCAVVGVIAAAAAPAIAASEGRRR